jgi:hypothetical protein
MANMNLNNFGILRGRIITNDIPKHMFLNSDGSVKMLLTIAPKRAFTSADGKDSDAIPVQVFVPAKYVTRESDGTIKPGIWGNVQTGDKLILQVHLESNDYLDKNTGKMVYNPPVIRVDSFEWDESQSEKQARLNKKQANQVLQAAAGDTVDAGNAVDANMNTPE